MILYSLSSCNAHKKVARKKETTSERQTQEGSVFLKDTIRFDLETHRLATAQSNKERWVEILPIGPFTFSPADGFRGEATRVLVRQKDQQEALNGVDSRKRRKEGSTQRIEQQRERGSSIKKEEQNKEVERPMISWIMILLILIGAGLCLLKFIR